jgi:hypothetical protein
MVPERYQLGAVGRFLLDQFELRRPGLTSFTPEIEAEFRKQAEAEILQMERQLHELGIDDQPYWLPPYQKIAQEEIALQARDYGIWRGGDLLARVAFAAAGLVLGIICVELPYIPVQVRWFPVLPFLAGPLFPDVVTALYARRYRKKLDALVQDLAKASDALDTYRPLSELTKALEMPSELAEAPAVPTRERS